MENDPAFDLNERLRQWRSTLENRPAIRPEDLEELEGHLTDTLDVLVRTGLSQEEAFLVGTHRVGHPAALEDQFSRAAPGAVWKERAQWMVLGILSLWMATGLAKVATSLTLWLGGSGSGHGFALGWTGLALQTLVILGFGGLVFGLLPRPRDPAPRPRPQATRPLAGRWILYFSAGTIVLGLSGGLLQLLAIRATDPSTLGQYLVVTQWGTLVLLPALVIVAGLWLTLRSRPLNSGRGVAFFLLTSLLVGCNPSGPSSNGSTSSRETTRFESCLALIDDNVNAAVAAFLDLDLAQGKLFSPASALSHSESEFVKLPTSAREKLGQQAIAEVDRIKHLAREVASRRNAARAASDTALAQKCNAQLATLGERLSGPDRLKLAQLVGKAVSRMATE